MIDGLTTEVAKVGSAIGEIDKTLGAFVLETRIGFACVDRRLGNIETRLERIEKHVAHIDSTIHRLP